MAFIGRLAEEKRPDWVLRLGEELCREGILTLVVGDGPLAPMLEAVDGQPWLRWQRSIATVEPALAIADVIVQPSRFEGIPLILLEALSLGKPVVATAVGGIPELAGTHGLELVPAASYPAFVTAVRSMLERPPQGIELPRRFSRAAMQVAYAQLFDDRESTREPERNQPELGDRLGPVDGRSASSSS